MMNKWQDYEAQAYTAMEQRDYRAAHLAFTHAIQLRQEHGDPDPPHTARLWNNVGALCRELGDIAAAQQAYDHALFLHRTVIATPQSDCGIVLQNLGELALRRGDQEAAWAYFTEELDLWKQLKDPTMIPHLATCLHSLGEIMAAVEAYAPARRNFEQALELRELTLGDDQPETADTLIQLGMVCRAQRDYAAARTYLTRAQQLYIQALGAQHPMVTKLQTILTTLGVPN